MLRFLLSFLAIGLWSACGEEYVHERGQPFGGKDFEAICQNTALKRLDMRGAGLVDKDMSHLANLASLEELRVDSHRLTPVGYEVLSSLPNLRVLGIENTSGKELNEVFGIIKDLSLVELDLGACRDFTGAGIEQLAHQQLLERLNLSCDRGLLNDKGIKSLQGFTELKHLDLSGHDKIKKGIVHLEAMTKLESLNIYGCVGIEDKEATSLFSKLTNLSNLNMGFCWWHEGKGLVFPPGLTDLELVESKRLSDAAFAELPCRERLVNVNLYQCLELTDAGVAAFGGLKQLESLNVGCIRALTNESLKSIRGNTGLTRLVISDNDHFDDDGLGHLADLRQLEALDLWHTKGITGEGFKHFAGMSKLAELNLADCYNLEDGHFSHISSLPSLERLYLNNCRSIGDAAIAELRELDKLQELTLPGCEQLTDEALTHIGGLKSLSYLDISNCVGLSDDGVGLIRKALPNCVIVR